MGIASGTFTGPFGTGMAEHVLTGRQGQKAGEISASGIFWLRVITPRTVLLIYGRWFVGHTRQTLRLWLAISLPRCYCRRSVGQCPPIWDHARLCAWCWQASNTEGMVSLATWGLKWVVTRKPVG